MKMLAQFFNTLQRSYKFQVFAIEVACHQHVGIQSVFIDDDHIVDPGRHQLKKKAQKHYRNRAIPTLLANHS